VNPNSPQQRITLSLKEGHVEAQVIGNPNYGTPGNRKVLLPPIIQPVVTGDVVIYRTDSNLIAVDLVTGETKWSAVGLPMERTVKQDRNNYGYYNPYGWQLEDTGRYTLTVAEGMVFTVANFRPPCALLRRPRGHRRQRQDLLDSSELVAISIAGRAVWPGGPA